MFQKYIGGKYRRNFNSNIFSMNCDVGCTFDPSSMPKSLYRSRAGRHFYGTENVIWAGFGPVGNTEKKIGPIMSNF